MRHTDVVIVVVVDVVANVDGDGGVDTLIPIISSYMQGWFSYNACMFMIKALGTLGDSALRGQQTLFRDSQVQTNMTFLPTTRHSFQSRISPESLVSLIVQISGRFSASHVCSQPSSRPCLLALPNMSRSVIGAE